MAMTATQFTAEIGIYVNLQIFGSSLLWYNLRDTYDWQEHIPTSGNQEFWASPSSFMAHAALPETLKWKKEEYDLPMKLTIPGNWSNSVNNNRQTKSAINLRILVRQVLKTYSVKQASEGTYKELVKCISNILLHRFTMIWSLKSK